MLGKLSDQEIEQLLKEESVGRIGCAKGEFIYVVPISYCYDGKYIYCHTREGLKVQMMRSNPHVCFEIDHVYDMTHWKSVIATGFFEELKDGGLRRDALNKLHGRKLPVLASETAHLSQSWPFMPDDLNGIQGVTFRIRILEKSGRFERSETMQATNYFS